MLLVRRAGLMEKVWGGKKGMNESIHVASKDFSLGAKCGGKKEWMSNTKVKRRTKSRVCPGWCGEHVYKVRLRKYFSLTWARESRNPTTRTFKSWHLSLIRNCRGQQRVSQCVLSQCVSSQCGCVLAVCWVSFLSRWTVSGRMKVIRIRETEDAWLTIVSDFPQHLCHFQTVHLAPWLKPHNSPFVHCDLCTVWAGF